MRKFILLISLLLLGCSDNGKIATNSNQENPTRTTPANNRPTSPVPDINAPVATLPEEVDNYARELVNIQKNPNAGEGVYGLWKLGQMASKSLTQSPVGGGVDILERLSEQQYQEVINKMTGYFVNRQEVVFVEADPAFFLALAKRTTDQASIDFFASYSKTRPSGTWAPVYVEQQTDITGCLRFGSMTLLDTYTLWDNYRKKYPSRYTDEANQILSELEEDMGIATCACGSAKSAIEEFEAFIHSHPQAKITARLRERVNQYKQGKSDIREQCISG